MRRKFNNEMLKCSLFLNSNEIWKGVNLDECGVIFGKGPAE